MWTTAELKERAQQACKANYWPSVLAGLVLFGTAGARGGGGYRAINSFSDLAKDGELSTEAIITIITFTLVLVGGAMLISAVMKVFLLNPLNFGCRKFYLENSYGGADLKDIVYAFSPHYKGVIAAGFMKDLYLFLWGMLFGIPAIIKGYSYMLTPYIIADNPDMSANEAITRSREMMDGHKWHVFCMKLSFIGWGLLSFCTLGLLGVFHVNPWYYATEAELYRSLKGDDGVGRADDTFVPTQTYGNDYNYDTNSYGNSTYGNNSYGNNSYDNNSYGSTSNTGYSNGYGSSTSDSSTSDSTTSTSSGVSSSDFPSFSNDDDF